MPPPRAVRRRALRRTGARSSSGRGDARSVGVIFTLSASAKALRRLSSAVLEDYRWLPLALVALGLVTRLPLLSTSLDEVDAANFRNALVFGYDIPRLRPHPPGYPVYLFMAWVLDRLLQSPLLTLTLLSAILGSLAALPFYYLLRSMAGPRWAFLGGLVFLVNPLIWSFSEAALSDVPSMFAALVVAWLAYRGLRDDLSLFLSFVALSLAVGIRQPNAVLVVLPLFALGHRYLVQGQRPWRLAVAGGAAFVALSVGWFLASVYVGSAGMGDYFAAVDRQWSTVVAPYDIRNVGSPWIWKALLRTERFVLAYFTMHAWTGSDDKTPLTVALSAPWVFGAALFIVGFRPRDRRHLFLLLWMSTVLYSVAVIHFLPRYALPQLPAFIMACVLGYRYLVERLLREPRRWEVLSLVGIGTVLVLYGVKYQPPVGAFEAFPPNEGLLGVLAVFVGIGLVVACRRLTGPREGTLQGAAARPGAGRAAALGSALMVALALIFGVRGYTLASIAHREESPVQRLVEYVQDNFDPRRVTPCWDGQTHSFYEAFVPGAQPTGFWSVQDLYAALDRGMVLLVSDRCRWFAELDSKLEMTPLATFTGRSPVWSKAPVIRLFRATPPPESSHAAAGRAAPRP